MSSEKSKLPKQLRLGKTGQSQKVKLPKHLKGGRIDTNIPEINWTRRKLTLTVIALFVPYFVAVLVSFLVGNYLIAGVFVGLGFLTIGFYFLLRYLERADW